MANSKKNTSKGKNDDLKNVNVYKASAKKQTGKNAKNGKKGGFLNYLRGVKQEFKKVVWPTREELTTDTAVVVLCVIFFSLVFWLIDTGFLAALKGILGITLS